ncbi:hypothetical protein KOR42_46230 [Thalassoglobus neptunius]|uniref:Uncharacterized protein n=1 Tax=Thalassoglobus neptunius TaxID=1938619 RepID=A0A5C5VYJ3_9PLAN|nr:hypothetical protein [Thalassoglobus neptunius]TWT42819.1 hypothetical protein KOR42_46230 [Thalassoglobus neptunius]
MIALVIWLCLPKPQTQVDLLIIGQSGSIDDDVLNLPINLDLKELTDVFERVAEASPDFHFHPVVTADDLQKLESSEELHPNGILIAFVTGHQVAMNGASGEAELGIRFSNSPNKIPFQELIDQLASLKTERIVLLMDLSHQFPDLRIASETNFAVELIQATLDSAQERFPDLELTLLTSTAPGQISQPTVVEDGNSSKQTDCPQFGGTLFASQVAEAFRNGKLETVSELVDFVTEEVSKAARSSGVQQTVEVFQVSSQETTSDPQELLTHSYVYPSDESETTEDETDSTEKKPEPNDQDALAEGSDPSFVERLATLEQELRDLIILDRSKSLTVGNWRTADQLIRDAQYVLRHNTNLNPEYEELVARKIDQLNRLIQQVSPSQADQSSSLFSGWIPILNLEAPESSSSFQTVMEQVIDEGQGDGRDQKLFEQFEDLSARTALVSSLLNYFESLRALGTAKTPEELQELVNLQTKLQSFFSRFGGKTGWRSREWPHQFLFLDEVLKNAQESWTPEQFATIVDVLMMRTRLLQTSIGFVPESSKAIHQSIHADIAPDLSQALRSLTAAERWLILGGNNYPVVATLVQRDVEQTRRLMTQIDRQLQTELAKRSGEAKQRSEMLTLSLLLAKNYDEMLSESGSVTPLAKLSNFDGFSEDNLTQATGSRVSREDAQEFLDLLDGVDRQRVRSSIRSEVERRLPRINACWPFELRVRDQYSTTTSARPVMSSFAAIRILDELGLAPEDTLKLKQDWKEFVDAIANDASSQQLLAIEAKLLDGINSGFTEVEDNQLWSFEDADDSLVQELVDEDLRRHVQFAPTMYGVVYRDNFPNSRIADEPFQWSVSDQVIIGDDQIARIHVDAPQDSRVLVYSDELKLNVPGVEVVTSEPWNELTNAEEEVTLRANPNQFDGEASPIVALISPEGIVYGLQTVSTRAGFTPSGWKLRISANGVPLNYVDLSDSRKLVDFPPNTGKEPLVVRLELEKPENSFDETVNVMLYSLDESLKPQSALWNQQLSLQFPSGENRVAVPLVLPAEGESPAPETVTETNLTRGFAVEVRPQQSSSNKSDESVWLSIVPRFIDPVDVRDGESGGYVEIGEPSYDRRLHRLQIPIRRKRDIAPNLFPPKAIPVQLNLSTGLRSYLLKEPPALPTVPEEGYTLVADFGPEVEQFIETTDEQDLEFGLNIAGLNHLVQWRVSRSGGLVQLGSLNNRPEIRTALSFQTPEGSQTRLEVVDGTNVIVLSGANGEKQSVQFVLEPSIWYQPFTADTLLPSERKVNYNIRLVPEGQNSLPLRNFALTDRFARTVIAAPGPESTWLVKTTSANVELVTPVLNDFGLGEGLYEFQSTLTPVNGDVPIASTTSRLIVDATGPEIRWDNAPEEFDVQKGIRGVLRVSDPQTGIETVTIQATPEVSVPARLRPRGNSSNAEQLAEFVIPSSLLPEIPPSTRIQRKPLKLKIIATNRVGTSSTLEQPVTLVQRSMKAKEPDNSPKFRDLTITISSNSFFDVTLTGPNGAPIGTKAKQKKSVTFPKLEEGTYQVTWTNLYSGGSGGPKEVDLKVPGPDLPPQTVTIP